MDSSQFFQGKGTYLNASHLAAGEIKVTIKSVEIERIGREQEQKLVIYTEEMSRGLVLNKTNYETLFEAFGAETDDWLGRQVTLYTTKTDYNGKEVDGVRMRIDRADYLKLEERSKPKPVDFDDAIPF